MRLKDGIIIAEVDEGFVAVDSDTSDNRFSGMIKLNETAKFIVEKAQVNIDYQELLDVYQKEYEISIDDAKRDVDLVLGKLDEANLLIK